MVDMVGKVNKVDKVDKVDARAFHLIIHPRTDHCEQSPPSLKAMAGGSMSLL